MTMDYGARFDSSKTAGRKFAVWPASQVWPGLTDGKPRDDVIVTWNLVRYPVIGS